MADRTPGELYAQAGGDPDRYRQLMREHGHLVPGKPEPLPCGWTPGQPDGEQVAWVHEYISTACAHDECGSCRATCKYCEARCSHGCHTGQRPPVTAGLDIARDMAIELLAAARAGQLPDELEARITADPALFWLRGEV